MKNSFKKYSNLITESLSLILEGANIWDIYEKYYSSKISKEDYDIIAHIDPTCRGDNKGKYLPWLIKQYLEVKPTLGEWGIDNNEWLKELSEAWGIPLAWYDKHKDNESLISDINKLNITNICDYYDEYKDKIFTQKEIKSQADIPYNDNEWEIVIPKTWEASKYYGANTKWCTASKDSAFHFKNYTEGDGNVGCEKPGYLYINIDKRNGKKYQFQFNNGEFFYEDDTTIMGNVIEATNMPENVVKWYFDNVPNAKLLTLNRTGHVQHYMLNTDFSKEIEISGGWSLVYDTEINEYVIYDKMNNYRLEDDDITCHYSTELINSALIGKNYVMMFQNEKDIILLHVVSEELKEYHFELLYNRYNIDRGIENTFVFVQKYNYTNFAEYGLYIFDVLDENRDGNFTLENASYEGEFKVEDDYYYSFRNGNDLYTLVHIYDGIVSDKIEKIISYDYDEKLMDAVWTLIIDGKQIRWDETTGEILSNISENVIKEDTNSFDIGSSNNYSQNFYESKKINKKIYITENQLPIIKEYRQQLTLPFDGKPYKNGFEDFIDYLEEIGKYGTLPPCTDFENKYTEFDGLFHMKEWETEIDSALCDLIFYHSQRFLEKCLNKNLDKDLTEKFYDLDGNCDDPCLILDCMEEICEIVNIPFDKYITFVEDNIDSNPNLWYSFDINYDDNGLIEIERSIDLDYILEKPEKKREIYPQIMYFYNEGLGLCWSWKSGNSESYNGNGLNEVVLYGRVNPNDVDWEKTQSLNIYLPNETELRLKPNVPIQLDSIVIQNGELAGKKIPLDKPIIVSSGTHY